MLGLLAGAAATSPTHAFASDPAALRADIALLARIYETLHPGLYRYQTPDQFKERCALLQWDLSRPLTLQDQYLRLSGLLAQVRCGHTYANFFNQSGAVAKLIVAPANKLPFYFVWIGSKMIVSANALGLDGLNPGDEILAIDGIPAATIQKSLLPFIRADGSNDDKRRVLLNVTGSDRIETFDVFFPLVFPGDRAKFALLVRDSKQRKTRTVTVAPIDQTQRELMAAKAPNIGSPDYWSLAYPRPGIALLTMPGWALFDAKWDWKTRIHAMFEDIAQKGAHALIIDIRDNEGGLDCGYEVIAHLIDQDLPLFADYERRVRFRTTPADLNPYLDTWDRSFEHLGEGATDLGNGFYRLSNDEDENRRIAPRGPRFQGKVIVLSGPQNSSATFTFIDLMRRNGLARIYGQPTGGNQRGINGGSFFFVRLPHSGLEADLPLVGTFPKTPKPDAGLVPDVRIDPTADDIAANIDPVLQRAISDLA